MLYRKQDEHDILHDNTKRNMKYNMTIPEKIT